MSNDCCNGGLHNSGGKVDGCKCYASAEDPALQYCPTYGMVMVEYDFIRELPCNRLPKVGCFDDGQ